MTATARVHLSVAKDFSRTPGPRRSREGRNSGEEFLKLLRKKYAHALSQHTTLLVDLDGAAGYATSFLEAAFGGLGREFDQEDILRVIVFKSDDEPDLPNEIRQYIREARLV